jgi:hypothetical protein
LQSIIGMMADTVASVSVCSRAALDPLHSLTKRIERANSQQELGAAKQDLADALRELREHAEQVQENSARLTAELEGKLEATRARVTSRTAARTSEAKKWESSPERDGEIIEGPAKGSFAAVLLVEQLLAITRRDGEPVRNRLLSEIGRRLRARLKSGDRLLRWKSGTFILVLDRPSAASADVHAEVRSMTALGSEIYLEMGSRSILMPVTFSSGLFDLGRFESLEKFFEEVDVFVRKHEQLAPSPHPHTG